MRFKFSGSSKDRLTTVHFDLQAIVHEALATGLIDFVITEGYRNKEDQNRYYDQGKSRIKYPDGKHNKKPSQAIDITPWVGMELSYNYNHCCFLAGIIMTCARMKGIELRWGGNWDMDAEPITDQDFQDLVHYELTGG